MSSVLYLLPTTIGDTVFTQVLPDEVISITKKLRHFVVEDVRTARRYLSKLGMPVAIDELFFYELNEHTPLEEVMGLLKPLKEGYSVGVMSEAGVPAVADPGSDLVRLAHQQNIKVVPLVGPSSILLAVMASGLSGQNFAFNGYLPIKDQERSSRIKQLEKRSLQEQQAQVFIETPYRNSKLLEAFTSACSPGTRLAVAANITQVNEYIKTQSIAEWKKERVDLNKQPCIFIMQA